MKKLLYILILSCGTLLSRAQHHEQELSNMFASYARSHPQEKIYVHTDKNFYLAGETIWFKIYVIDGAAQKPLPVSSIAYIEILDKYHKPLAQIKTDVKDATGNGSFTIPASAAPGSYILRAYTNWMKNEGSAGFFHTDITITNTLVYQNRIIKSLRDTVCAGFFPEGGSLVNGKQSVIAFETRDWLGGAVSCSGAVFNQKGDSVTSFHTTANGMGSFLFTPIKGNSYVVRIQKKDRYYTYTLPSANDDGYVLTVKDEGNSLGVTVAAAGIAPGSYVYLLLHTRRVQKSLQAAVLNTDGTAYFSIDKSKAGDGVSHIILFDQQLQPVGERMWFKQPERYYPPLISFSKGTYSVREKAIASLQIPGDLASTADLSVSVFLTDELQQKPCSNIVSWLMFSSELDGTAGNILSYLNSTGTDATTQRDLLMLTHGWRKFKWHENSNTAVPHFLPEVNGQVIEARVTDRKTEKPAKGITVYATVPGTHFSFTVAVSNDTGSCFLNMKKTFGRSEMILQADSGYSIETKPFFSDAPFAAGFETATQPVNKSLLLQHSIDMQAERSYQAEERRKFIAPVVQDSFPFYGRPDKRYYLDDYTRFPTMEEVIKEFIQDVTLKKEGDKYRLRVTDLAGLSFFDNDPLLLLDGVPVTNTNKLISMSPLKIKYIDVIPGRYYYGPLVNEGIVSCFTYDGSLGGFELDPNSLVLDYDGLQQQQEFYSPVYETELQKKSRIPDFRNVLYWNSNIKLAPGEKKDLSFFTSDRRGTYVVVVEGLSQSGQPLTVSTEIHVQ